MTQKEFEKLSKEKVKELNQGGLESEQAWRDGYLCSTTSIKDGRVWRYV